MTIIRISGMNGGVDKNKFNQSRTQMRGIAPLRREVFEKTSWITLVDGDSTNYEVLETFDLPIFSINKEDRNLVQSRENPTSRLASLAGTTRVVENQTTRYCGKQIELYSFREIRGLLVPIQQEEPVEITSRDYTTHLFENRYSPPTQ